MLRPITSGKVTIVILATKSLLLTDEKFVLCTACLFVQRKISHHPKQSSCDPVTKYHVVKTKLPNINSRPIVLNIVFTMVQFTIVLEKKTT